MLSAAMKIASAIFMAKSKHPYLLHGTFWCHFPLALCFLDREALQPTVTALLLFNY